jgi:hypothetical protein
MNTDSVFRQLDPPPGGAERFARRLDEADGLAPMAPRSRAFALAGAACAFLALVAAAVLFRSPREPVLPPGASSQPTVEIYNASEFDRLLGRPAQPEELIVTVDAEPISVTEIETQNEKIRIYRIN